jgi:hypothetical protein
METSWRAPFANDSRRRKPITAEQWQNGVGDAFAYTGYNDTFLRKRGDKLETSRGATVAWRFIPHAFVAVQDCRLREETWKANGDRIPLGDFAMTRINADGSIIAGCHTVSWHEIERLAVRELPELVKPRYPLPVPL